MTDYSEKGIYVITTSIELIGGKDAADTGASYGQTPRGGRRSLVQRGREFVSAAMLKRQISGFLEVIEEVFSNNFKAASEMELDEISNM